MTSVNDDTASTQAVNGQPLEADAPDITKLDDLPTEHRGHVFTMSADIETLDLDKQLKIGRFRDFEFYCDEPQYIGGDDQYPQPLTYVAAGVGFCVLTQVQRVASMTKKRVTRAEARCEFDNYQDGSVLKGDLHAGVKEFRVHLVVDSPEPLEEVQELLRLAKNSCFAEALVRNPIPLISSYTVNGERVEVPLDD